MQFSTTIALLAAAATSASATVLKINNWSDHDNVMWYNSGEEIQLPAHKITNFNMPGGGDNVLKMAVSAAGNPMYTNNIMQFEWSTDSKTTWDLSMINGNPFGSGNVKVTPQGNTDVAVDNWCKQLKCPAGQVCSMAYQPGDPPNQADKSRACPTNLDTIWIDLWEPEGSFNSKKREVHFSS